MSEIKAVAPWRSVLAFGAAAVFALAACGGSSTGSAAPAAGSAAPAASSAPAGSEAPVPSDASATDIPIAGAASKLADLTSYKFKITMSAKGTSSAAVQNGDLVFNGTVILKPAQAIDFSMETTGDTASAGAIHFIAIGDKTWMDFGSGVMELPASDAASQASMFDSFKPDKLFGDTYDAYLNDLKKVGDESKNGVDAIHFTADEKALGALSQAYGVTGKWSMDLWLAKDGGYLVSAAINGASADGTDTGEFKMTMDITDIDNSANVVKPPK